MTPQEKTMLGDLIRRIQTTNLTEVDPEAQEMLQRELGSNSDALYVLAQTVLVQNYALEQARAQIDQLKKSQAAQPAKSGSFLGSIFGHHEDAPRASNAPPQPPATQWTSPQGGQGYPAQSYPGQGYAAPGYPPQNFPPQPYPSAQPSGGSSFLRSAATTAAGVAAGALAFEGVESLMHGFGHQAGFGEGSGFGGGMGVPMGGETIVNNYYDTPGGEGRDGGDRYDNASDPSDRDMPAIDNASYTGPQDDDDLQPELDQADDVNVGDDGSYDDASDDSGGDSGGGDDSSFV